MAVQLTKDSIDLGIVVTDIEASLKFYRDTLGFTFVADGPMPGGMHMWRLMCGTSMIKLVTFDPTPEARPAKGGIGGATSGIGRGVGAIGRTLGAGSGGTGGVGGALRVRSGGAGGVGGSQRLIGGGLCALDRFRGGAAAQRQGAHGKTSQGHHAKFSKHRYASLDLFLV